MHNVQDVVDKAASAGATSSVKATLPPPLTDPKKQQQATAPRPHTASTSAALLQKAPTKTASFSRLSTPPQAVTPAGASSSVPAITAQPAPNTLSGSASSQGPLKKLPGRQASDTQPKAAHQPRTAPSAALSTSSPTETATAATSQTPGPLPSSPSPAVAPYSRPAASKAQSGRNTSSSLSNYTDQLTMSASQSSSPLADDWEHFLGSPTVGKSTRPPGVSQRRTHSSQRLATSSASGGRAAMTPQTDPSTAANTRVGASSTAVKPPQGPPSTAARTPQGPPSVSAPKSAPAVQPTAPLPPPETPPSSEIANSVTTQLSPATKASSRFAKAQPGSQTSAASLQDSAASVDPRQQRPLPRPAVKLTGTEPAAKGGRAQQASTATTAGDASSASSDLLRLKANAKQGIGSKAATGTGLFPHGAAAEPALTPPAAKLARTSPPQAVSIPHHFAPPASMDPATLQDPDEALSRPAGSASASASRKQALTAPRATQAALAASAALQLLSSAQAPAPTHRSKAGSTASSMVSAVAAAAAAGQSERHQAGSMASSNPAPVPRRARSSLTSVPAAAATTTDVGNADKQSERRKPGFTPHASVPVSRPSLNAASAAAADGDDAVAAAADGDDDPTPSAVAGVSPFATPLIPFAGQQTSPKGLLDEDADDFFVGVEADLVSVPSRGDHMLAAQAEDTAQAGGLSQQSPQQASATQLSNPLAILPAQAKPETLARTAADTPTAVAPVPTAAFTVPSAASTAASTAASSSASSAAAALVTLPAAALPSRVSLPGAKAPVSKPAGVPPASRLLPTAVETLATAQSTNPVLTQPQQPPNANAQQAAAADEDEESEAEMQSAFVPIPFGGSAAAAFQSGTGTLFGSHLDADQNDVDDSFFDSIHAGVVPLPSCMSSSMTRKHAEVSISILLICVQCITCMLFLHTNLLTNLHSQLYGSACMPADTCTPFLTDSI